MADRYKITLLKKGKGTATLRIEDTTGDEGSEEFTVKWKPAVTVVTRGGNSGLRAVARAWAQNRVGSTASSFPTAKHRQPRGGELGPRSTVNADRKAGRRKARKAGQRKARKAGRKAGKR